MTYQTEVFGESLRRARLQKGWSQRDLSAKARTPQAQISRVESGAIDARLSTVVDLARLLDLELVLVPRSSIPAVEALIREAEANTELRTVRGLVNSLQSASRRLRREHPTNRSTERLATLATDLPAIAPLFQAPGVMDQLREAVAEVVRAVEHLAEDPKRVDTAIRALASLRNGLVHAQPQVQTPAYTLDEDE